MTLPAIQDYATRRGSLDEVIADPLFRAGYEDVWRGREACHDVRWSDNEQLAYERGRHFGVYVKQLGDGRVPLVRGSLAHPRARLLLMMAARDGDIS